ncbi:MAG: hypothetical protein ACOY94_23615 [Bacillota bacterium]
MPMPRLASILTAALILTACAGRSEPQAVQPPPPPPAQQEIPTPTLPSAKEPRPIPTVLAKPATEGPARVTFKAGEVLAADGVYFLNTATGEGEGWVFPESRGASISQDNRFIATSGVLIDRESRSVWEWNRQEVFLLLAEAQGFLFGEVEPDGPNLKRTGRYFWAGPDFKLRRTFTLEGGAPWGSSALLSPDGSRLVLSLWGNTPDLPIMVLLDLNTGEVQRLEAPAAGYIGSTSLKQSDAGFQAEFWATDDDRSRGAPRWHTFIRRYSWSGEALGDLRIPGTHLFFSPDGKWVAWQEWPAGDLAPATRVADTTSLEPHLLALGVTPCFAATGSGGTRWLADSRGLLVDTSAGYRLLTLDGQLQELLALAGLTWKGEPQPAPDHPDRFAIGRLVVTNGAGTQRLGVTLEEHVTPASLSPWGASSAELRFALPPKAGGGACMEGPPMPAQVLAPGKDLPEFPLLVRSPDRCLSLRDRGHESGRELACLPDGTRLAPVRPRSDIGSLAWTDSWWLSVRTEKGETGWIPLAGTPVTWAVP